MNSQSMPALLMTGKIKKISMRFFNFTILFPVLFTVSCSRTHQSFEQAEAPHQFIAALCPDTAPSLFLLTQDFDLMSEYIKKTGQIVAFTKTWIIIS